MVPIVPVPAWLWHKRARHFASAGELKILIRAPTPAMPIAVAVQILSHSLETSAHSASNREHIQCPAPSDLQAHTSAITRPSHCRFGGTHYPIERRVARFSTWRSYPDRALLPSAPGPPWEAISRMIFRMALSAVSVEMVNMRRDGSSSMIRCWAVSMMRSSSNAAWATA